MIVREGNRLKLQGELTLETVPDLFMEGLAYMDGHDWELDLSGVKVADSAAVSMVLGWMRAALASNSTLRIVGMTDTFASLAGLYGVADMLSSPHS